MSFDIWKLVDNRSLEDFSDSDEQLICDIDKTYLETKFESIVKLAKIPFEKYRDKVTVSGAKELIQAYRQKDSANTTGALKRPVHFVSSSPSQLRKVLSDKLLWDGLSWSSDTFKNQSYNLAQGRFGQLRNQIAYKTAAILNLISKTRSGTHFHMIGDTAESDATIYLGVKLFAEGRISRLGYLEYLTLVGVPRLEALQVLRRIKIPQVKVAAILLRRLPGYDAKMQTPLTDPILAFDNYFEACLFLHEQGLVNINTLPQIARSFHKYHGISTDEIHRYLDLLRERTQSSDDKAQLMRLKEELVGSESFNHEQTPIQLLTPSPLDGFNALTEAEILQLAAQWHSAKVALDP